MDTENGFMPEIKKREYDTADRVFAFICVILGYFVIRTFKNAGLGATVTAVLATAATAVYMSFKGALQRAPHFVYLLVVSSFSFVFVLSDDGFIKALTTVFIFGALAFYPYFTHGSGRREFINDMFIFDMIKAVLIMPFSSIINLFPAAFSGKRKKKSGFRGWYAAVGLAAAVIPTLVVAWLLCSADAGFKNVMDSVLSVMSNDIFEELLWIAAGVPLAMYFFGMLYSNASQKHRNVLTKDQHDTFTRVISVIPAAIVVAAVTPVCVLYVIFLSVQAKYYFSGFAANLPDGMTYAEYARSGFFELCAVAVINMIVIVFIALFTKKKENDKPCIPAKIYSVVLSCFTLLLIAVAMSKMIMYIDAYGLTRLRVFTSWFMILLAFAFVFVIIKQFSVKFNYFACFAAVFAVLFGSLCFCDVDARIAEYNVNAYIKGQHESIDMVQLSNLSDSAVPYIYKLTEPVPGRSEEQNRVTVIKANEILSARKSEYSGKDGFIYFNFPRYFAAKIDEKF